MQRRLLCALAGLLAMGLPRVVAFEDDDDHQHATRRLSTPFADSESAKDALVYGLAFIMVLIAAHPLGVLFPKYLKLPLITGYLIVGIIAGPFVTELLPTKLVDMLSSIVSALALSFISFQAGQEIYLPELKPQIKGILQLLLVLYVTTMVILTGVLMLGNNPFFFDKFESSCQLAIALMFGSIAVLGSPATVMAIKIELNSVGRFTNLMLGATMTAEFVVLVSFSVSRVVSSIYCAKLDISVANLIFTLAIVLANLVIGAILALVIIAIFLIPGGPDHDEHSAALLVHQDSVSHQGSTPTTAAQYLQRRNSRSRVSLRKELESITEEGEAHYESGATPMANQRRGDLESGISRQQSNSSMSSADNMPHPHNAYVEVDLEETAKLSFREHCMEWIGSLFFKGFLWLLMGHAFYIGTMTISEATIAGYGHSWDVKFEPLLVLMTASCLAGHYSSIRHDMHIILDTAAPYIFLPFFVMTGAALKLDQVVDAIPLMSLYVVLRFVSIFIACYVGGRFVLKLSPEQYNNLWLTMTPQAGVALGLANEVKGLSTEPWAAEFASTIVAAVVVNQIIGPVLCAIGLSRAGESLASRMAAKEGEECAAVNGGVDSDGKAKQMVQDSVMVQGNGDPRPLLPFYKVQNAVVIGEDEVAFEVALELSLYGAHVNVPLLDEELAEKWHQINDAILARTANGDLIKYKNKLQDSKHGTNEHIEGLTALTDVVIFTGEPERTIEHVKTMQATMGRQNCPRLIAVIPDCTQAKTLKDMGVLLIQPSIALANILTRMALLDLHLAQQLSNEISTTSNFSTASYFLRHDADRDSEHSISEMRLNTRRLALGRSVVNHHNVNYEKVAEALMAANQPLPPPPPRVSMFGTTAPGYDPFAKRQEGISAYEYYAVDDDLLPDDDGQVFEEQFMSPRDAGQQPLFQRSRSQRSSQNSQTRAVRRSRSRSRSGSAYVRTNSSHTPNYLPRLQLTRTAFAVASSIRMIGEPTSCSCIILHEGQLGHAAPVEELPIRCHETKEKWALCWAQ
ncbi:hypothetical protein Poli38472_006945 [Pythium oligandrum]|uniref:Cation/H+ exchanger transmembrane domain-containing protein n=1 Tax=Pythium oligandrum TaxID=41045 RepID=A0A8K1FCW9_PYTOL|nr:hypothetical protein Poli38472_006945 [Pythium oligandrum]|eukprot:TMW58800.1 hypothetical protein Poli38472_006945 [Pythium oligandrum]